MTQPSTPAQPTEAMEQWQQAIEALRPALEAWREAMLELRKEYIETLRPIIIAVLEWWTAYKREALYRRLCRWRFPHWLARLLADRWPSRMTVQSRLK